MSHPGGHGLSSWATKCLAKLRLKRFEKLGLTQKEFSGMIGVSIKTLQNWEQGRREPEGPAKALLRVVEKEPQAVLSALHA